MTAVLDRPSAGVPGGDPDGDAAKPRTGRRARRSAEPTGQPLRGWSGTALGVSVLWLSLLVVLPLAAVAGKSFTFGWHGFVTAVTASTPRSALGITLGVSAAVAVVNAVMGVLVAWVLVRERFRGAGLLEMVIDIPFALPTIVAGVVMLALYGPDSPIGLDLHGSRYGLFVTLLFVTLPFTVRTVQPVLLELDRDAELAAASLGAAPVAVFRRVVLPHLLPAALSGAALAFARAIGEYGSLVFISSNIPGQDQVVSQLIYGKLQDTDHPLRSTQQACAVATVLLVASALVLVAIDLIQRRTARRGARHG